MTLIIYGGHIVAQPEETEPNLKAAYIYNFTRYISWEAGPEESDFIIGEMGHSGLDSALGTLARNYLVNNRRIVLRHFNSPEDIDYCHILFIPAKCGYSVRSILAKLGKGVLTIGERKGDAREGVALNFVLVNEKLKFEANEKAISKMGLKASSQLLKLAIMVQ
ncbi:MAG TPA: YfiR family protein [Puia sp.]|uniref:YfiR family protein n=1 Tax=Puia sp. TaxID=2045100 RepID=UPI002BFE425B|nr:YfiR family protein [Puia sp.]HVU94003.1 YfiR family protein [Puia sp.]